MLVVYPFFTDVLGLTKGVAAVFVLLSIISYYSLRTIYDRLKAEVKDGAA